MTYQLMKYTINQATKHVIILDYIASRPLTCRETSMLNVSHGLMRSRRPIIKQAKDGHYVAKVLTSGIYTRTSKYTIPKSGSKST